MVDGRRVGDLIPYSDWIDSMSTHIDTMQGSCDEKTKTLTFHAEMENPADGKPMKMRLEFQFNDDGTRALSEFVQMDGQKDFAKVLAWRL